MDTIEAYSMFGKKRKTQKNEKIEAAVAKDGDTTVADAAVADAAVAEAAPTDVQGGKDAPVDRAVNGPFDVTEVPSIRPYIDMGGIKVAPREGLKVRLDVDQASKRIVAISMDYAGSTMQVQAFSAPKSTGIWSEVRAEIKQGLEQQGATVIEQVGRFGGELIISPRPDAPENAKPIRFIGVDGPRWMLRGVIVGDAAAGGEGVEQIESVFRELVVVRGQAPMPPRELLPLRVPAGAAQEQATPNSVTGNIEA